MRRILLAAFAAFFISGAVMAQDVKPATPSEPVKGVVKEPAAQVELTAGQSERLELALLRSNNALMEMQVMQAQFDKLQEKYQQLQKAANAELLAVAREAGLDPDRNIYILTPDYKKLILKDQKK